jgi:hypothetical protein
MDFVTILSVMFVIIGAAMTFLAVTRYLDRRAFLHRSEVATGTVVALVERAGDEETAYAPKVSFRTAAGNTVTFESDLAGSESAYKAGDTVEVRYQRDQPQNAELASFWALWGPAMLFGALGLMCLGIGLGILSGLIPVSAPAR